MKSENASKVVLITGASSGIGKAIAEFLLTKNMKVYGTSRRPERVRVNFPLLKMDVTQPASVESAVAEVIAKAGKIDVLINNAGVGITGPIEETPDEEISKAFDTNFLGPIRVTKAVLHGMRQQQSGCIIQITSIAGYMGLPYRGIYSASKGALELATEAWRMELREFGISMTCVAPGDFATNIAAGRYHVPVQEASPYKGAYSRTLNLMNEHVDRGQDPEILAKEVWRIISDKKPRVHYRVGKPLQKFSVALKRLLPDKVYERLLLNHYKL